MNDLSRKQELIEILSDMRCGVSCFGDAAERVIYEALTKAIDLAKTLSSEQSDNTCENTCEIARTSNDYISRRAALDAIKNSRFLTEAMGKVIDVPSAQPEHAICYLDSPCEYQNNNITLPSAQQWIPCSERLPEYYEPVLTWDGSIYCVEKRIPYICDDEGEHIVSGWWVSDAYDESESDYYPNLRDGVAIAWMPLPEPYKGEQE